MLMNPAYPDLVGEWADGMIEDDAKVWRVSRGPNGGLQEQLDPQFLTALGTASSAEEIADVLINVAGEMEIAEHRLW
jgi:hypothetical protein